MAGFSESAIGFTENIKLFEKFGLWWVIRAKKIKNFWGDPYKMLPNSRTPDPLFSNGHCLCQGYQHPQKSFTGKALW